MKATAQAPANIAFIKYWGKRDPRLNLPLNNSISMNLSNCSTLTTVEFSPHFKEDKIILDGKQATGKKLEKTIAHLDRIRNLVKKRIYAKVVSQNNFPAGAGIASSASGFAALTLAATWALGLKLSQKELSILSRLGSGSACRSIPDGFVEWDKGRNSASSFAKSIAPEAHWTLIDIIVIVSQEEKSISSTDGHALAPTSPYFKTRLGELPKRTKAVRKAIAEKDLEKLGEIIEEEAISLHVVAMTSRPPIFYWKPETLQLIEQVKEWRKSGLAVYFTIDAGPNLHLITEEKYKAALMKRLKELPWIKQIIVNKPAAGAHVIS